MCYDNKRPVVDPDNCVMCDVCTEVCPNDAFYLHNHNGQLMWLVEVEKCCSKSCGGECWDFCPVSCLGEHPCPGT